MHNDAQAVGARNNNAGSKASGLERLMAFPLDHLKLMVSTRSGNNENPRHPRSLLVGVSSYCYLLPAIAMLRPFRLESIAWAAQANLSFAADYVYYNEDSYWHIADRCGSTALFLQQMRTAGRAIVRGCPLSVSVPFVVGGAAAAACLEHGRNAETFSEWEKSQAAWHGLGALVVAFGARKFPAAAAAAAAAGVRGGRGKM